MFYKRFAKKWISNGSKLANYDYVLIQKWIYFCAQRIQCTPHSLTFTQQNKCATLPAAAAATATAVNVHIQNNEKKTYLYITIKARREWKSVDWTLAVETSNVRWTVIGLLNKTCLYSYVTAVQTRWREITWQMCKNIVEHTQTNIAYDLVCLYMYVLFLFVNILRWIISMSVSCK